MNQFDWIDFVLLIFVVVFEQNIQQSYLFLSIWRVSVLEMCDVQIIIQSLSFFLWLFHGRDNQMRYCKLNSFVVLSPWKWSLLYWFAYSMFIRDRSKCRKTKISLEIYLHVQYEPFEGHSFRSGYSDCIIMWRLYINIWEILRWPSCSIHVSCVYTYWSC